MLRTLTFDQGTFANGLESWGFLKLKGKSPVFASLFGDVFLQSRDGVWFLDAVQGCLTRVCRKEGELGALLAKEEGGERYLRKSLVTAAEVSGIERAENEVFDFTVPPALGGRAEVSNVVATDFVVKLNIDGQIHAQVRTMKPGSKISGLRIGN